MAKDILYPLRRVHGKLHDIKVKYQTLSEYKKIFKNNPNTVFLILTPEHGNLGDHAIALAEINLLKKLDINYIELTGNKLSQMKWADHLSVMNKLPIMFQGGGYLGTLWFSSEEMVRNVLKNAPKSLVTMFPNTFFYENTNWGNEEFEKSKEIYNSHKNLYLYARENNSYEIMRSAYNNVKLIPDMVLSFDHIESDKERQGCLLCLRSDCEKTRTEEQEMIIRQQVKSIFGDNVRDTDMVVEGSVTPDERENALNEKFREFSGAELVVTDRLHGMIFCAITGTPCVVVNSKSPKVRGCYEWIKHLEYIRFADDVSKIADEYNSIPKTEHKYDNSHLKPYFEELANDIKSRLKGVKKCRR